MSKLFCLYWVPGSCGDLLQNLIAMNQDWYIGSRFELDSTGRYQRRVESDFASTFPSEKNNWLWRSWAANELDLLQAWNNKNIMIGTHSIQQVRFIKKYLGHNVTTLGITYGSELFPAVIKNFCVKVAESDHDINQIYQQNHGDQYHLSKQQNTFGSMVLKDFLKFGGPVPQEQQSEFDIDIKLGSILSGHCEWFEQWLNDRSRQILQQWTTLQDPLYQVIIENIDTRYIKALGINPMATIPDTEPIKLDNYHQTLIQHHYPQAPNFETHYDFKYFLESIYH